MKNKLFYSYIIIEFLIFIAIFFFVLNPLIDFNIRILSSIGLGINIIYSIVGKPKEKIDRWFNLAFCTLIFISELLYLILDNQIMHLSIILGAFAVVTARLFLIERDSPKIKMVTVLSFLFCHTVIFILLIFSLIDVELFFLLDIVIVCITNVILMIHRYRNGNMKHKPNWFFGSSGTMLFLIYALCAKFGPLMDDTAMLKVIVITGSRVLVVPAILMVMMSFMLFEPLEA